MAESYKEIREFFGEREWNEMDDYEKSSYLNRKRNYLMMVDAGLKPQLPVFMRPTKAELPVKRNRTEDVEWVPPPKVERRVTLRSRGKRPKSPTRDRKSDEPEASSPPLDLHAEEPVPEAQSEKIFKCAMCHGLVGFDTPGELNTHVTTHKN